jgi:hypothetical protein
MKKYLAALLMTFATCAAQPAFAAYPPGAAQRQLRPLMTEQQVVNLLGEPDAVEFKPGRDPKRIFTYTSGINRLAVVFNYTISGAVGLWTVTSFSST